jgi:hypothetical protein
MRFIIPLAFLLLFQSGLSGQIISRSRLDNTASTDMTGSFPSSTAIKELYLAAVSQRNEFINGKEFVPYFYRSKTSPLMFSGTQFHTTLYFNNRVYSNITLQYDTFTDEAVFTDTSKFFHSELPRVALNKKLIEGFKFSLNGENYDFRYLRFNPKGAGSPDDGYYEVVYEGPSELIIKHYSKVYLRDAIDEYKYFDQKYVLSGNAFRKVSNLKELLALFGDQSQKVRDYIHNDKIKFRKADKNQISAILKYYDTLERQESK